MDQVKFGLLTVLGDDPADRKYRLCRCDCGAGKRVRIDHLRNGKTISCGCERARRSSARTAKLHAANTTHGLSGTRVYVIWLGIKQRCRNPNTLHFERYGGRGIAICERWLKFENFYADMGEPPEGMTIERIDNDKGYEPGNCRWATRREQQNNRSVNRIIEFDGRRATVAQWARELGIHRNTLDQRLDARWDLDRAFLPEKQANLDGLRLGGIANGARNRAKTHCKWGHAYDEANTRPTANGGRRCLACHRDRQRLRYAASKR